MSSIQQNIQERVAALEQSVAEMRQSIAEQAAKPVKAVKAVKQSKKAAAAAAAAAAEGGSAEPKAAKEPTAWNILVTQTVAEMKQSGWESWTDLKGVVWSGSRKSPVKDKKGTETGTEQYVFDGGDHDGKPPSPALGGMVRASYLKTLTDPEAKAKALAYHAKLDEKRSNGSIGSGAAEEPVADAAGAGAGGKKGGRPKMTEEQKAAAKLKRDAKKSASATAVVAEEQEMAAEEAKAEAEAETEAQTPKVAPPPTPVAKASVIKAAVPLVAPKGKSVLKKAETAKKLDLSLFSWTFEGVEYYTNDRKDVVDINTGEWVGRFNGTEIDESVAEPADFANGVSMREV